MRVENDVLAVLSRAEASGNALRLVGQLDRKMYERVNRVVEAAGGKWNRKAKAHLYEGDAAEAMEQIILTGEVTVPQNFGYFPTPRALAERVIERAKLEPRMLVLEPSAGRGALAAPALLVGCEVDCVELLEKNVQLLCSTPYRSVVQGDFLEQAPRQMYDRVVMNPPFAKQDDIRHVLHAVQFLKPGGLLVSIMSASVTFRDNRLTNGFRQLVEDAGGLIEPIEEGAFKDSGTMVRTVLVEIPA